MSETALPFFLTFFPVHFFQKKKFFMLQLVFSQKMLELLIK